MISSLTFTLSSSLLPTVRRLGVQAIALAGFLGLAFDLLNVLGLGHDESAGQQSLEQINPMSINVVNSQDNRGYVRMCGSSMTTCSKSKNIKIIRMPIKLSVLIAVHAQEEVPCSHLAV
jgi:hypothetical protein